jgi:hypothetical protein
MMEKWSELTSAAAQHLGIILKDVVNEGSLSYLRLPLTSENLKKYQESKKGYDMNKG